MEAIVLAGGFGTRLSHIVTDVPKPMAPVAGLPFLKYVLDDLITKGITYIVLAVSYKKEIIMDYFQDHYRDVPIHYSVEETPLMTGGAIKQAMSLCSENEVFVVNGDTFFSIDYNRMLELHRHKQADITIAVKPMCDFERYGAVEFDKHMQITDFLEKKFRSEGFINGGAYLISKEIVNTITMEAFSFEKEVLEKGTTTKRMFAFSSTGYFIDIGIPEDYYKAQKDFGSQGKLRPAAFFDRDGTINVNYGHVYKPEDLTLISGMGEIIHNYNMKGWPVIVITNQAGIAKGYYDEADMHRFNKHLNKMLLKNYDAHIDAFYFCPHHPDYTGECTCRKPEPGMILRAQKEFNIDLAHSVFYGDKESDREAALRAGVQIFLPIIQ